jgi:hypothetical protein
MTNMIYTAMPALPKKHHTNAVVLPSEWNTCPLSSIVEEISETVGTRKIETVSISAGIGFVNQAEKFGRELSGKQYEQYIVLHKGDFSYNKGNSNIYPQGCIYRLNNRTEAAVPNVFESFRVSVGNPDYYEQLFLSGFLNRQLYSKINRGVRDNGLLNLKGKDFYSCEVPYPPLAEQERIAEILIQCDRVIELKEQKLDELKQLKKEFLRKMFPAKGCDTPEIRFPGFTGAWKQRKLGEIATFINGRAYSQPELLSSGKYKVLRVGNFYTNDSWYYSDLELGEKYYADYGDLLYTWSATFGPHIWLGDRVIYHYHIWKINLSDQLEKQFAVQLLEQDRTNILSSKNGSTMVHITKEGMEQKDVIIPPSTKEQQEIGAFFLQLDNLITLHQRELEETKTYKKTLAKLLLTGIVRVQG